MSARAAGDTSRPHSRGVLLAHPSGNQFFRHLAAALHQAGLLAEICTCIDWQGGAAVQRLLPSGLLAELERRSFSRDLGFPVNPHPWHEIARLAAGKLGLQALVRHETGRFSVDAVYRDFDRWLAERVERRRAPGVVYAYEDAAEAAFTAARKQGWKCVYDLPIAYWETSRRLLEEEAGRWPEWEPTLGGTRDSPEKLARKSRELALADLVVCPSRFVADSLPGGGAAARRVLVAPFGSPPVVPASAGADGRADTSAQRPLRVLFAGSMTQRKGLADLLAAMQQLKRRDVHLVVLGTAVVELGFYRRQYPEFIYEPTRPHAEVLALMRSCDAFCLPSIVEGRALVVQEAMSVGLPAIVTPHTGADDVVEEGRSGFVVPIRSPAAIAGKIAWLADHREAAREMGRAAQAATQRFSWRSYGELIVGAVTALELPA